MIHMVAVGERAGQLEAMLRRVADAYESEVDTKLTRMTALLEPLMIVVMGGRRRLHRVLDPAAHHGHGLVRWSPTEAKEVLMHCEEDLAAPRPHEGRLTLLEIMIVLAILGLVVGFLVGPRCQRAFQESKDGHRGRPSKYAHRRRSYNGPTTTNGVPAQARPTSPSTWGQNDTKDPWGPYKMFCGQPAGRRHRASA